MEAYQERVLEEKMELDAKVEKLAAFIYGGPVFQKLPKEEQSRLDAQLNVMKNYSAILGERIQWFKKL